MTFVVGKRCKPFLLYVVLAIVGFSLIYLSIHRERTALPQKPPLHQH